MLVKLRMLIVVTWGLVYTKLNLCGKTSRNPERCPSSFSRNFLILAVSPLIVRTRNANYPRCIVPTSLRILATMSSTTAALTLRFILVRYFPDDTSQNLIAVIVQLKRF